VSATDDDFGSNAEISYHIRALDSVGEGSLSINPTSGVISAEISFDYEISPRELEFEVTATDRGDPSLSGSAKLRLSIEDTNDLRPFFERAFYFFNVSEDALPGKDFGSHKLSRIELDYRTGII